MIDSLELILLARDGLTELPESVIFSRENLLGLIPQAITLWQDRTNANPEKRHNFLILSDNISIRNSAADISEALDEFGYRVEYIAGSDVLLEGTNLPKKKVTFVNSWDRLAHPGRQDKFSNLAYLQGKIITFRNPLATGNTDPLKSLNARFKLNSVVIPNDLNEIPNSVMSDLALILAEIAKGEFRQQNRGLDIN